MKSYTFTFDKAAQTKQNVEWHFCGLNSHTFSEAYTAFHTGQKLCWLLQMFTRLTEHGYTHRCIIKAIFQAKRSATWNLGGWVGDILKGTSRLSMKKKQALCEPLRVWETDFFTSYSTFSQPCSSTTPLIPDPVEQIHHSQLRPCQGCPNPHLSLSLLPRKGPFPRCAGPEKKWKGGQGCGSHA